MNANQLQKYYDQLTPRERLAAQLEAALRGDEQEITALKRAASKKVYDVTDNYFLSESLDKLASTHLLTLLNMGVCFYMGQGVLHMLDQADQAERFDMAYDGMVNVSETFKIVDAAWQMFCKGQGINPDALLINLPGSGVYSKDAPEAFRGRDTLPQLRAAVEVLSPEPPDPAAVAGLAKTYQDALTNLTGQQSGGWG